MTSGLLIERCEFALRFNSSQELFLCGPKFISSAFAVNSLLFSLQTVDISIMLHYMPNLTFCWRSFKYAVSKRAKGAKCTSYISKALSYFTKHLRERRAVKTMLLTLLLVVMVLVSRALKSMQI